MAVYLGYILIIDSGYFNRFIIEAGCILPKHMILQSNLDSEWCISIHDSIMVKLCLNEQQYAVYMHSHIQAHLCEVMPMHAGVRRLQR